MKKLLLIPTLFLLLPLLAPKAATAQVSCPSAEMQCGSLDAAGGCQSPCLRVITAGRGGGRGGQAWCQCQLPQNSPGTVPEGGACQTGSDCVASASYCWAEPGQAATCHSTTPGTYPTPTGGGVGALEGCPAEQINTAIGCISFSDANAFIEDILQLGIGIGGGIAFILMLIAGFQIMTSAGNPDRLRAGQELLTSAIAGLILLVFSVFILRTIGIDILGITSLGTK